MVKGIIEELERSFWHLTEPSLPDLVVEGKGGIHRQPPILMDLTLLLGVVDHGITKYVPHQLPRSIPCLQSSLLALTSPFHVFPSPFSSLALGQIPSPTPTDRRQFWIPYFSALNWRWHRLSFLHDFSYL